MSEITRYDLRHSGGAYMEVTDLVESQDGDWVKYTDHAAELSAANKRIEELERAISKQQDDVCQSLGKALGYPWFKDDQKNFLDATEADGVCVGDNVAESIAEQAAEHIAKLTSELEAVRAERDGAMSVGAKEFEKYISNRVAKEPNLAICEHCGQSTDHPEGREKAIEVARKHSLDCLQNPLRSQLTAAEAKLAEVRRVLGEAGACLKEHDSEYHHATPPELYDAINNALKGE